MGLGEETVLTKGTAATGMVVLRSYWKLASQSPAGVLIPSIETQSKVCPEGSRTVLIDQCASDPCPSVDDSDQVVPSVTCFLSHPPYAKIGNHFPV